MKKKDDFLSFIVKNRYVILLVSVVLLLSLLGIIRAIMEFAFTILLIILAIYVGKRIQEDNEYIKRMFEESKKNVYDYKTNEDDEDKNNK